MSRTPSGEELTKMAEDYDSGNHPQKWDELNRYEREGVIAFYRHQRPLSDRLEDRPIASSVATGLPVLLMGLPGWVLFALEPFRSHSAHLWVILVAAWWMAWTLLGMVAVVLLSIWISHEANDVTEPDKQSDPEALWFALAIKVGAMTSVFAGIANLVGGFSAIYLQTAHDSVKCFSPAMGHADAVYFTIATLTATGSGNLYPESGGCRLLVASQAFVGLIAIAIAVAGLVALLTQRVPYRFTSPFLPSPKDTNT
jgi:hypothetical protein